MDYDKIAFLFGQLPPGLDPDDPDDRSLMLEDQFGESGDLAFRLKATIREVIANQIADNDPPETWSTARRMLHAGIERETVMHQLSLAMLGPIQQAIAAKDNLDFDPAEYLSRLTALPLPSAAAVHDALVEVVIREQPIAVEQLIQATAKHLSLEFDDLIDQYLDLTFDPLMNRGVFAMIPPDRVIHPETLLHAMTFTHRVTAEEIKLGILDASFDLPHLGLLEHLTLADGRELTRFSPSPGRTSLVGPDDWLEAFEPKGLVAFRVDDDGVVRIEAAIVAADPALVVAAGAVLELEYEEPGLPVYGTELATDLLAADRSTFARPRLPLSELAETYGWMIRRDQTAPDASGWERVQEMRVHWRALEHFDESAVATAFVRALDLEADDAALSAFLPEFHDPLVAEMFAYELIGEYEAEQNEYAGVESDAEEAARQQRALVLAQRMIELAGCEHEAAAARYMIAILHERAGEPLVAEAQLQIAHDDDPENPHVTDRLAWYAADRGDARAAVGLWRTLEPGGPHARDLMYASDFERDRFPTPGRNDRCWCGSGRKFKHCHLGTPRQAPLAARVPWLYAKAAAYLERRGPRPATEFVDLASTISRSNDPDEYEQIRDSPIPADLLLVEGGWWEDFLEERGPLLPDDEALLAVSWDLIDRALYEIEAVDPGGVLQVRDLATGERLTVRGTAATQGTKAKSLLCGRAVPDGEGHQFVGLVLRVPVGRETALLDVLDRGGLHELADWISALFAPPTLNNREHEPLIDGRAVLVVPAGVIAVLNDRYEGDNDDANTWIELFPITPRERILRASFELTHDQLEITANSEARLDRAVAAILDALPGATVLERTSVPMTYESVRAQAALAGPLPPSALPDSAMSAAERDEMLSEYMENFELDWCDQPIPALDGLTPLEAVADPTRRPSLDRLLVSYDEGPVPGLMRPDRLRALLGIEE